MEKCRSFLQLDHSLYLDFQFRKTSLLWLWFYGT